MGASGDYSDFKTETSKSVEKELYTINAKNLYTAKKYDEAIKLADRGLIKFPGDNDLTNVKGLSFFGSGKSAELIDILRKQSLENPKNAETWFNLGVMLKTDPSETAEAEHAFNKAVEIKPDYVAALQNLTFLKMGDDQKSIDDYNAKRKAGKIEEANKILADRRARLISALPAAEKWYAADPTNLDAVTLLRGLYQTAKNDAKTAEFKAKEAELKAKAGK
ncbi:tetratricopeptide repeat protein [Halpernia sp. GG3]